MLNRYLLITLGGSGEMLARYLTREVERRLQLVQWREGVPDAWRWLSIDVAERADPGRPGVPSSLGRTGTRLTLARYPDEYRQTFDQLTAVERKLPGLMGAIPPRDADIAPPYQGAGQRPQVGNAVAAATLKRIADAIGEQASAARAPDAGDQLARVSHQLGSERAGDEVRTTFIVASSLGGGAGAGLLQVVLELLLGRVGAGAQGTRSELFTVLFTPDVFVDLTPYQRDGVAANSLYTVSTMINAHEGPAISPALAALLEPGGAIARDRGRAADTNFFVGRDNGSVDFQRQTQVVEATAKALGRVMTDYRVTNGLTGHLRTNRQGSGVTAALRITDSDAISRPVSSLGYASVSLAGDDLMEYARQRLAKAQLERLLNGYRDGAQEGERVDDALDRAVAERLPAFLERAKLRSEDLAAGREAVKKTAARRAETKLREVASTYKDASGNRWLERLEAAIMPEQLPAEVRKEVVTLAERWALEAESGIVAETERAIGELGIDVARELLAAVRDHMKSPAPDPGAREEQPEQRAREVLDQQRKLLRKAGASTFVKDAPLVEATGNAMWTMAHVHAESAYVKRCSDLTERLAKGVVETLYGTLTAGRAALDASATRYDRDEVARWSDGPVPRHLRPARNQLLLTPVAEIPKLFERRIRATVAPTATAADRTTNDRQGVLDAIDAAVTEILTGNWEDVDPAQRRPLVVGLSRWRPDSGSPARFELELDAQMLLDRAERWVRERRGALRDRIVLPIQEWLTEEPDNEDKLADALERALAFAKPLLSIDSELHERVHEIRLEPPELFVSEIPEPTEPAVRARIERALDRAGLTPGAIDEQLAPVSAARVIEISSFVARPVHPVVADGLFGPIVEDFAARTQPAQRGRFSVYRRTRPLPLFVPLAPARQRAFVRGWVAARILGQLDELVRPWSAGPLTVWTPRGRRPFPRELPIVEDLADDRQALGRVLEAMPLALASYACKRYEELEAYMRLLDLGDFVTLGRWVQTGAGDTAEPGFEAPPTPAAGGVGATAESRRAAAVAAVDAERGSYEAELVAQPLTADSVAKVDLRREIAEVVIDALRDVDPLLPQPATIQRSGSGDDGGAAVPAAR